MRNSLSPSIGRTLCIFFGVIVVATIGQVLFAALWFQAFVQDRSYLLLGGFLLADFVASLPFVLPFAVGGFLLLRAAPGRPTPPWRRVIELGAIGGVLFWELVQVHSVSPTEDVFDHLDLYARYVYPLVFSVLGAVIARNRQRAG